MTENKILGYFTLGAIIFSCYLTRVAVTWEDHPEVGIIDHFIDFHIDVDHILADADAKAAQDKAEAAENKRHEDNVKAWCEDLLAPTKEEYYQNERGICSFTPDRDK